MGKSPVPPVPDDRPDNREAKRNWAWRMSLEPLALKIRVVQAFYLHREKYIYRHLSLGVTLHPHWSEQCNQIDHAYVDWKYESFTLSTGALARTV